MAITDLTNTTWVFNDTITQLPQSPYYINFSASWAEFDKEVLYWKGLGVDKDQRGLWAGLITQDGSSISATGSEQLYSSAFGFWLVDKTITITGGIDVRSPDLISWLEANGTLQGGETSAPKLYIGNKAVTSMSIGNKAILKMYVGNSLIYEKASGENLISFTVGSTTYQAEDGMTWAEWCDSEYNLGGFYVSEGTGGWVVPGSTSWVVPPNGNYGDHVYGTNVIISGGAYTLEYD